MLIAKVKSLNSKIKVLLIKSSKEKHQLYHLKQSEICGMEGDGGGGSLFFQKRTSIPR